MDASDIDTRHTITIIVKEIVDLSLPDEGGALVSVEHSRLTKDAESGEAEAERIGPDDLLDVISSMAIGTILQSGKPSEMKFHSAVTMAKAIITEVSRKLRPSDDIVDAVKGDLTDEQQAALDLAVSSPSFKLPTS